MLQALILAFALLPHGGGFGPHGEGFIRLSYANSVENIKKALERIEEWVGKNKKN